MKNTTHSTKTFSTVLMHISRIVLGAVFVFSGFVKAIDPLGYTFKIEEYFTAFGGFFEIFAPLSFLAAIAFSALELLIGLNLLFSVQLKWTGLDLAFYAFLHATYLLHLARKSCYRLRLFWRCSSNFKWSDICQKCCFALFCNFTAYCSERQKIVLVASYGICHNVGIHYFWSWTANLFLPTFANERFSSL